MSGAYHAFPCPICGRSVSDAGFARASHAKMHARQGLYEARTFGRLPWKAAGALLDAAQDYAIALDHAVNSGGPLAWVTATTEAVEYEQTCKRVADDVTHTGALRQSWV